MAEEDPTNRIIIVGRAAYGTPLSETVTQKKVDKKWPIAFMPLLFGNKRTGVIDRFTCHGIHIFYETVCVCVCLCVYE